MKKLLLLLAVIFACVHSSVFALTIGGFDGSRAGDLSLRDGTTVFMNETRDGIEAAFPGVVITATDTLTDAYLGTVDVVILTPLTSVAPGSTAASTTSLSGAEQAALLNFVLAGGGVLVMGENDSNPFTDAGNESFFDPFQVDITGTPNLTFSPGNVDYLSVTNGAHPVIAGPFGTLVENGSYFFAYGWLDNLGPYASEIMSIIDSSGAEATGVAVIETGAIAAGSGRVVLMGDSWDYWGGYSAAQNGTLILNSLAFAAGLSNEAEPVPTLTEWGMIALITLLAGAAFVHVRRLQGEMV